jgi:hypothetical protein
VGDVLRFDGVLESEADEKEGGVSHE